MQQLEQQANLQDGQQENNSQQEEFIQSIIQEKFLQSKEIVEKQEIIQQFHIIQQEEIIQYKQTIEQKQILKHEDEEDLIHQMKCQHKEHNNLPLSGSCENVDCKQEKRIYCKKCKKDHLDSKICKKVDLKKPEQLKQIIQSFKAKAKQMSENVKMQTDIQRLIIILEMIEFNQKCYLRDKELLEIQRRNNELQEQIKNDVTVNKYRQHENKNQGIYRYFETFQDSLLEIEKKKDDYIKNQDKQYVEIASQQDDFSDQKINEKSFKDISETLDIIKDSRMSKISEDELFKSKQRDESNQNITIIEVLLKQGFNIKSTVPLKQSKYLQNQIHQKNDRTNEYKLKYLESLTQVYSLKSSNLDQSLQLINQSIELNATYSRSLYLKGIIQYDKKFYQDSIQTLQQCIKLDDKYVDANNALGNCYKQLKEYNKAIECYDKALEIDPFFVKSYIGKATVLKDQTEFEKALDLYEKAIDIEPNNVDAYCGRGIAFHQQKEYYYAIQMYDRAIKLDSQCLMAYINKGLSHQYANEPKKALEIFDQAIQKDPNSITAYNHKGKVLYQLKKYEEALQVYDKILTLDPKNLNGQLGKGELLIVLNKLTDAQKIFENILELEPNNPVAQRRLKYLNRPTNQS